MRKYFFCNEGNTSTGPFTLEQLKQIKTITIATRIWFYGLEDWEPAGEIRELEVLFNPQAQPMQTSLPYRPEDTVDPI